MRYLETFIKQDLKKKMVFVGGPRQCGKTTLAKHVLKHHRRGGAYLNWDFDQHRHAILNQKWQRTDHLLVFDELHKYRRWKNWLKGLYDVEHDDHNFLITGSARLDVYRRGGDSLMGRYHYWRLHPFSLSELPPKITAQVALRRLLSVGGFPEPFFDADEREARRWRRERFDRIIRDDLRDLEPVREIQTLQLFVEALRRRVGSMVVLSNIAQELQVAPKTLKHWLSLLERMYLVFVVRPWTKKLPRAIIKPPKVYFFDNMDVIGDEGARFENLVATHLLKRIHFLEDRDGHRYELCYVRDKEGREVDFVVVRDGEVIDLFEAKVSESKPTTALTYYAERLKPQRAIQIVLNSKRSFHAGDLWVTDPIEALSWLR